MPPRRNKTGSEILKEIIKNIKKNSSPKSKKAANNSVHYNNNDGLDGRYYLEH